MGKQVMFSSKITALMILAVLGFGLLQGSRLLDHGSGPYSSQPFVLVGIIAGGACCVLLALLSYFANFNDVRPVFAASLALMAVRIALMLLPFESDAVALASQLAAGVGWMLILLCWMQVFVSYRPVYSVPMVAAGYLIDLAVVPLTNALVPEGRQVVFLAAFVASVAALGVCLANNRFVADAMLDDAPARTSMKDLARRTGLILLTIFAISAPCGFVVQSDILNGLEYVQSDLTALLAIAVSSVLLVLLLIFRPRKRTIDVAYPVSIMVLVLAMLLRVFGGGDDRLSGSVMAAFLMTFYGVFWITFIREAHERRLPAFFLLGLAVGVAQLSLAAGRLAALALQGTALVTDPASMVVGIVSFLALALSCAATACAVRIAGHHAKRPETVPVEALEAQEEAAAGRRDPANPAPNADVAAFDPLPTMVSVAALDLLRDTFGLSKREFQVVTEYSTGRSARYIADALMLSEYTIKAHLRRAYAKMDVHSRQELLSLIDRMEAEIHARS